MNIAKKYKQIRHFSEQICKSLKTEDYVVQPIVDVSPPKWHLGHTSWFFETFALKPFLEGYEEFNAEYNFVFNSYYETLGARVIRTDRGNLSRPSVEDVYKYRAYIDQAMQELLQTELSQELCDIVILGLNHEQQHQELLWTDIKYILGHNPLFPQYAPEEKNEPIKRSNKEWLDIPAGLYQVGYAGKEFCFDNELSLHQVYLQSYKIACNLVTNCEYLEFINDGGYHAHLLWHAEGLDWVKKNYINSPLYWHNIGGIWHHYTLHGLVELDQDAPVCHVSYYEASAFASWKGMRLPTEFEWEAAANNFDWGKRWEWTNSAYLPYPGFTKAPGAIGEYNGKFMVNQMVLRGASEVTPHGHSRISYRNFFHPYLRWQYTGIRLAQ